MWRALPLTTLLFVLTHYTQAGYNPASKSNIAIYWGQNSAGQQSTQTRLSHYCNNPDVDIIILSFLLRFNGPGNQPILNFANQGDKCSLFAGTETFNCPEIASDIPTCQSQGKTILLSLGGDAYTEGGFTSPETAIAGADKIWAIFGPVQPSSGALRPFANAVLDGFDFDFEANVSNMQHFGNRMRKLMDDAQSAGRRFYLTAAPQCPFPDWYNKEIIDNVPLDFLNVQFYNNGCGVSSYVPGAAEQWNFNFATWDEWARTKSVKRDVRILLGVPANTGSGRGYLSPGQLAPVVEFSGRFERFGGVMMWDASQAWNNGNFVGEVKGLVRRLGSKMRRGRR